MALRKLRDGIWGIRPRNKEQHCALDLLLCDDIKLVTLIGKAGTGKTMLALATGLQKVVEEQVYSKLLVSRPIFPLGRDVGYLPGRHRREAEPLDAADLRQRRVPDGPLQDGAQERTLAIRS